MIQSAFVSPSIACIIMSDAHAVCLDCASWSSVGSFNKDSRYNIVAVCALLYFMCGMLKTIMHVCLPLCSTALATGGK